MKRISSKLAAQPEHNRPRLMSSRPPASSRPSTADRVRASLLAVPPRGQHGA